MTTINKSIALALMANYQQHIAMAGNTHSQVTLSSYSVILHIFADTLPEIIRYRRILLNLGVWKKDIEYDFFAHEDETKDFHLLTYTIEIG